MCIYWMFEKYPDRNPQWLTEHKMAMVSNKFLAALAVVLGFDKLMILSSPPVLGQISDYANKVRAAFEQRENDGNAEFQRDFWTRIDSPPKALSDIVESYVGAVFVDSGFRYEEVEGFFDKVNKIIASPVLQ